MLGAGSVGGNSAGARRALKLIDLHHDRAPRQRSTSVRKLPIGAPQLRALNTGRLGIRPQQRTGVHHPLRHLGHALAAVHGQFLQVLESLLFAQAHVVHQDAFGAFNPFAV